MKRSNISSLDDLRAFEATARLGSVRAAADELALTHGAVSRRVTKVSAEIGVALFEKSGRGLRLTPEGEELFETCARMFAALGETLLRLRQPLDPDRQAIVLSCERSVAMRWLIPRLSQFQEAHPDIVVHLSVGGGPIDFAQDRITLAIRRLDFPLPESWQVEHLLPERTGPVMAPHMLAAFEAGAYVGLSSLTRPEAWNGWLARHPDCPAPKEIRRFDHHFLMVEAASAGLGVALSPEVLAIDDITRQRLVAPMGFSADGTSYGLLFPKSAPLSRSAGTLAEWLRKAMLTHPSAVPALQPAGRETGR